MCLDVMRDILEDEKLLNELYSSSTSSRAGVKVIKHYVIEYSNNSSLLTDNYEVFEGCNKNRKNVVIEKCFGASSRIGMNNLTQLLNKKIQQTITLIVIKRDRKKNSSHKKT